MNFEMPIMDLLGKALTPTRALGGGLIGLGGIVSTSLLVHGDSGVSIYIYRSYGI